MTPEDDSVLTQGTVQTGAVLNAWWLQEIVNAKDAQVEQAAIPLRLLGQNRVLFFPHLNGEKTLYANPNLRGAFVGLSLETTRENMYLAVLEGLAFGCRQLYEQMGNQTTAEFIRVVGGGAKSKLWLTILPMFLAYRCANALFNARRLKAQLCWQLLGMVKSYKIEAGMMR